MKNALNYLIKLIDDGYDFAEALFKASCKYHVKYDILTEAYDNWMIEVDRLFGKQRSA